MKNGAVKKNRTHITAEGRALGKSHTSQDLVVHHSGPLLARPGQQELLAVRCVTGIGGMGVAPSICTSLVDVISGRRIPCFRGGDGRM